MKTLKNYITEARSEAWNLDANGIPETIKKSFATSKTKDHFDKAWYELKEWLDANAKMLDTTEEDYTKNHSSNKTYILLRVGTGGGRSHNGNHIIDYTATNGNTYMFTWNTSSIWKTLTGSSAGDGIVYGLRDLKRTKNITDGYLYEL